MKKRKNKSKKVENNFLEIGYTEEELKELEDNESNDDEVEYMLQKSKDNQLEKEINKIYDTLDYKNIPQQKEYSKSVDEVKNNFELQNKVVNSFCENISTDMKIKKRYSKWLIAILIIQFFVYDVIFFLVGLKILDYSEVTLNLFISSVFIEAIGLVAVIVKYIFADNITESLRIIAHINEKEK